ncbi:Uncharacterized protein Fot_30368 [Forsythia ovata]|uniref:Uncharacterized protein n=1 Tax=Forsythia ovata TaxID=205694 RepID=A0ABD1TUJ0_9LAMI
MSLDHYQSDCKVESEALFCSPAAAVQEGRRTGWDQHAIHVTSPVSWGPACHGHPSTMKDTLSVSPSLSRHTELSVVRSFCMANGNPFMESQWYCPTCILPV